MSCQEPHKKDEWCGIKLTQEELNSFMATLEKLSACCIPHSTAWCSANECPSCVAQDMKAALIWIDVMKE